MANPPRNTKENCKTLGNNVGKIATMGLESTIRAMKKRPKRFGDHAIAEDINAMLPEGSEQMAGMDIWRWWKKHKDDDDPTEDIVNIYSSHLSSLKSIERQLERLEFYLDNLDSQVVEVTDIVKVAKETNGLMATYDKLSMRKSALLGIIGDIQARVYSYMNFTTVTEFLQTKMKAKDELWYHQCITEISKDPVLSEVLRKIKDDAK